jgi:hypothetical protein
MSVLCPSTVTMPTGLALWQPVSHAMNSILAQMAILVCLEPIMIMRCLSGTPTPGAPCYDNEYYITNNVCKGDSYGAYCSGEYVETVRAPGK